MDSKHEEVFETEVSYESESPHVQQAVEMMNQVIASGQEYTDHDFPAKKTSLMKPKDKKQPNWGSNWIRARKINSNVSLFKSDPRPDDIQQGSLGDCYYLACLAAMAEYPERVRARFINKSINKSGIYGVVLYISGEEHVIIVDDLVPCWQGGSPICCKFRNDKLWVILMEKVWAKMHGSYVRTWGGWPHFVWPYFTGMPAYIMPHKEVSKEDLWDRI